jgi:hypothetical protein
MTRAGDDVKYELWYSASEKNAVLLHESDRSSSYFKAADATVIWSVEADTYDEARQKRDEYLESERPNLVFLSRDRSTTRFTYAEYLDGNGQTRSLTAPGWVGMVRPLMDALDARVEVSVIVGQLFFERPGAHASMDMGEFLRQVAALGIEELTIVDLRSVDGTKRMCQEFYGRIQGPERIHCMVRERLGAELPNWQIVESTVLRGPS